MFQTIRTTEKESLWNNTRRFVCLFVCFVHSYHIQWWNSFMMEITENILPLSSIFKLSIPLKNLDISFKYISYDNDRCLIQINIII
jgi:hypothetical protein